MLFKLLGVQNWTATLEDRQFLTKLNIPSSNHASRYLLKKAENLCPHKNLHMNSYRSFIYNCQKLEVTKMSLNKWTDKQNCGTFHIMNYYSAIKRKKLSSQDKTQRKLKSIMLNERDQSERLQYYMIQTIWHSGKDKSIDTVKWSVATRSSEEGKEEWMGGTQGIWGREIILCEKKKRNYSVW